MPFKQVKWTNWTVGLFVLGMILLSVRVPVALSSQIINGAGATFPYPLYAKWAHEYARQTGIRLNYQSIGSGGGIRQIEARTVDFGASDAPMSPDELDRYGLVQFPMIIGGVVPVFNLDGIGANRLRMDGTMLADIFLGKITRWDDPRIRSLNPGVSLPSRHITVVHRSDGSGTSWIFTHYLKTVSHDWGNTVGAGKSVDWPIGLGGKGNEGVASYVKRMDGAIGYVEYAYAMQNGLATIRLKNLAGYFVEPTAQSFQAAAKGADWAGTKGMAVVLVNQPGKGAWPVTGASFILMYKKQGDSGVALRTLRFFDWCYRNGADIAVKLLYVPVPRPVYQLVERMWCQQIRHGDDAIWQN